MADHLTSEQIAEIKETFSLFDKGGVGTITLDEMGIIVRALGQTPSQAELEIMKKEADPDESGRVDYPEFLSVFAKYQKEPVSEQEIMNSFEELDDLKKGTITIKKLRYLMSTCGHDNHQYLPYVLTPLLVSRVGVTPRMVHHPQALAIRTLRRG